MGLINKHTILTKLNKICQRKKLVGNDYALAAVGVMIVLYSLTIQAIPDKWLIAFGFLTTITPFALAFIKWLFRQLINTICVAHGLPYEEERAISQAIKNYNIGSLTGGAVLPTEIDGNFALKFPESIPGVGYDFCMTDELGKLSGIINADTFGGRRSPVSPDAVNHITMQGMFTQHVNVKIDRNVAHAQKNNYSLMLIRDTSIAGAPALAQYFGFTHIIPVSQYVWSLYVDGKISDNFFKAEYVSKDISSGGDEPYGLILFCRPILKTLAQRPWIQS